MYESTGVDDIADEPILRKAARRLALRLACEFGSVHCRSDTTRRLRQLIADGQEFHQNVRRELYCAALHSANSNDFNFVWNRMLSSQDSNQRYTLSQSMGCVTSRVFLNQLLGSTIPSTNENDVIYLDNEALLVFRGVYSHSILGMELALDFLIENAVEAYQQIGSNGPYFLWDMLYEIMRDDLTEKVCNAELFSNISIL